MTENVEKLLAVAADICDNIFEETAIRDLISQLRHKIFSELPPLVDQEILFLMDNKHLDACKEYRSRIKCTLRMAYDKVNSFRMCVEERIAGVQRYDYYDFLDKVEEPEYQF